jgi:hypothetical protein
VLGFPNRWWPFAVLARSGCSTHANLALALTAEFAALRDDPTQRALDELATGCWTRATVEPATSCGQWPISLLGIWRP